MMQILYDIRKLMNFTTLEKVFGKPTTVYKPLHRVCGRPDLDHGLCVLLEMLIIAVTQLVCECVRVCVCVCVELHFIYF